MEQPESQALALPETDRVLSVPESAITAAWALMSTRDWPLSLVPDIAKVKDAFVKAKQAADKSEV